MSLIGSLEDHPRLRICVFFVPRRARCVPIVVRRNGEKSPVIGHTVTRSNTTLPVGTSLVEVPTPGYYEWFHLLRMRKTLGRARERASITAIASPRRAATRQAVLQFVRDAWYRLTSRDLTLITFWKMPLTCYKVIGFVIRACAISGVFFLIKSKKNCLQILYDHISIEAFDIFIKVSILALVTRVWCNLVSIKSFSNERYVYFCETC